MSIKPVNKDKLYENIKKSCPHISKSQAQSWIDQMSLSHEEGDISYHIWLNTGIQPRETGILFSTLEHDENNFFSSPENIFRSKSFQSFPDEVDPQITSAINRSRHLVPIVREIYASQHNLKLRTDLMDDILQFQRSAEDKSRPWLKGVPGAIYEDSKGKIVMVDFKIPSDPVDSNKYLRKGADTETIGKIAHHSLIMKDFLKSKNIDFRTQLVVFNTAEWKAFGIPVSINNDTLQKVNDITEKFWFENIVNQTPPERNYSRRKDISDLDDSIKAKMNKLMVLNTLAKKIEETRDEEKTDLMDTLNKREDVIESFKSGETIKAGVFNIQVKKTKVEPPASLIIDAIRAKNPELVDETISEVNNQFYEQNPISKQSSFLVQSRGKDIKTISETVKNLVDGSFSKIIDVIEKDVNLPLGFTEPSDDFTLEDFLDEGIKNAQAARKKSINSKNEPSNSNTPF